MTASVSPEGTTHPFSPFLSCNGIPPVSDAMIGMRFLIACKLASLRRRFSGR